MVIVFVLTALVLTAAPASAQWRPVAQQCLSGDLVTGCTQVPQMGGAWNLVVSPDGETAYGAAFSSGAIQVFDRNPSTGRLTPKQCLTWFSNVPGCTSSVPAIRRPNDIMVSADGKQVYVGGEADAGVPVAASMVTFTRDPSTGLLTFSACINENGTEGCTDGTAVGGHGALLSPDQKNIYALGASSLRTFNRAANGVLTEAPGAMGCYSPDNGCTDTTPRPGGRQLVLSANGSTLYVPSFEGPGILVFNRDTSSGAITQKPGKSGCLATAETATCTGVPQIGQFTENIVSSPGGNQVYLSHNSGIVTFTRNGDGTLAFRNCINDTGTLGCSASSNVSLLKYMAMSPDGEDLLAVPQTSPGGFTAFARDASSGALTRRASPDGCVTPDGSGGCIASTAVNFFGHITFAGDQMFYGGFLGGSRISLFKRDFYATCDSRTVSARHGAATAVPLTCSDRNGDAVTRAIVQLPTGGTLGAVDGNGNVFYNPFPKFSGTDHFAYSGISAGLQGPVASVAVTVPRGPKPKPRRIRGITLAYTFDAFTDHTVLTTLAVKGVPRRSTVRVVCRCGGKARTFKKKHARGTVKLKRFVGRSLPAGSHLAITVTKRHTIGAAKLMTIRSHAAPKVATRCLKPGSNKLRTRC